MSSPQLQKLLDALIADGSDVRFVGGCVRDTLLNQPVSDIDIGVPFDPDAIVARLSKAGIRAIPTGIDHGTVTALVDEETFEVTSLRKDIETDGRRAVVGFTTDWSEDALRRDFTMNALSARPDGQVFDYFGGIEDLEARRVRFVGVAEERIREDALRILRFYRFIGRFGVDTADPESRTACSAHADSLSILSRERIGQEFLKTIVTAHAPAAVRAVEEDGVLARVADMAWDVAAFAGMVALEQKLGLTVDAIRRVSALVGDPARAEPLSRSLRLSNAQADRLLLILSLAPDAQEFLAEPPEQGSNGPSLRRAFYRHGAAPWRDAILLAAARTGDVDVGNVSGVCAAADEWSRPVLPVRGADLVARGLSGRAVGKALEFVERWWIAQDFQPGRDDALDKLDEAVSLVRMLSSDSK